MYLKTFPSFVFGIKMADQNYIKTSLFDILKLVSRWPIRLKTTKIKIIAYLEKKLILIQF